MKNNRIDTALKDHQYYLSCHEYQAATVAMAEIFYSLSDAERVERDDILGRLTNGIRDYISDVQYETLQKVDKIRHILSIGQVWNEDEILLILTDRIQIELIMAIFRDLYEVVLDISLNDIDEQILSLQTSTKNSKSYVKAVRLIQKNNPTPPRCHFPFLKHYSEAH